MSLKNQFFTNYTPDGMFLWDPWFIQKDSQFHLFHLQAPRTNDAEARHHNQVSIGHAVSYDLKSWTTLATALKPGANGEWDDVSLWTGSVFEDNDQYYLFYTARTNQPDKFWVQRLGVATSSDLLTWKKYPGNPILEADQAMYHMGNEKNALGVIPAFRDPYIYRDNDRNVFVMLFAGRMLDQPPEYNGCIGVAESKDLLSWKLRPPLLAPGIYDEMEVPQLIKDNGMYYLFFMTYSKNTEPRWRESMGHHDGLHCYWSHDLLGEYLPVNGNGVVPHESGLLGLRLIEKKDHEYRALGWYNDVQSPHFLALSSEKRVRLDGDNVTVVNLLL